VLRAVSHLPEKYREVIVHRYLKGLDGKNMALYLGEPEGTIRNRLFRAIEKLREGLPARGGARGRESLEQGTTPRSMNPLGSSKP
jgi:DNA-directed RNA polymerase specialized sigma24 family protein